MCCVHIQHTTEMSVLIKRLKKAFDHSDVHMFAPDLQFDTQVKMAASYLFIYNRRLLQYYTLNVSLSIRITTSIYTIMQISSVLIFFNWWLTSTDWTEEMNLRRFTSTKADCHRVILVQSCLPACQSKISGKFALASFFKLSKQAPKDLCLAFFLFKKRSNQFLLQFNFAYRGLNDDVKNPPCVVRK